MEQFLPLATITLLATLTLSPLSAANGAATNSTNNSTNNSTANNDTTEQVDCSAPAMQTLNYSFSVLGTDQKVNLCESYATKLIMVVNTASKCAFTPQYDGLESLYRRYKDQGFVVLGFPSNDFAGQEPGTEKQIKDFCQLTYGVNFPMFEKIQVKKGAKNISPFYQRLGQISGEYPGWNFHKYLISPDGSILASFKSHIKPNDPAVISLIEKNLNLN